MKLITLLILALPGALTQSRHENEQYLLDPKQLELPLMTPRLEHLHQSSYKEVKNSRIIPKIVWIAVRNLSEPLPQHFHDRNTPKGLAQGFISRNQNWTINFCDNAAKDDFMREVFANTSILWAYSILNPLIGYLVLRQRDI